MELNLELRNVFSSALEDTNTQEPLVDPKINVWDTRKAWEQEFNLYPEVSREEVYSRLYIQVGKLLHILQEQVDRQTWNKEDKYISHAFRLSRLTEKILRDQANGPNM